METDASAGCQMNVRERVDKTHVECAHNRALLLARPVEARHVMRVVRATVRGRGRRRPDACRIRVERVLGVAFLAE